MSAKLDLSVLKNIDFSKALGFLKRRWVPLACALVVIGAPLVAWLTLGIVRDPVAARVKERLDAFEKLGTLERTNIDIRMPDGSSKSESAYVNAKLIDDLTKHHEALAADAAEIYKSAVARNRAQRGLVKGLDAYLPKPKDENLGDVNLLRENALPLLQSARDALLASMKVAGPAKSEEVLDRVQRAEAEHLTGVLMKKSRAEVTDPKELAELNARLVETRLAAVVESAASIEFYVRPRAIVWRDRLSPPKESDAKSAAAVDLALAQLFQFQWDLWVVEDVLSAIRKLNAKTPGGPLQSPVKCLNLLQVNAIAGLGGGDAAGDGAAAEPASGEPIDPKAEVAPDYAASFTGLHSNQLYDVRESTLVVVCETSAVPRLVNALAAQNFIVVSGLSMLPVDTFAEARQGYAYGPKPCSEVTLRLQSVWLRDWTTERMPKAMMTAIKTAGKPAPPEAQAPAVPAVGG